MDPRPLFLLLLILAFPPAVFGTTAPDLSSRVVSDGIISPGEYEPDELLSQFPLSPEADNDSKWSVDGAELTSLYLTWDRQNLYLAVEGNLVARTILLVADDGTGGVATLEGIEPLNRRIDFRGFETRFAWTVAPGSGRWRGLGLVAGPVFEDLEIPAGAVRFPIQGGPGAAEITIPLASLGAAGNPLDLRLAVMITGARATGAADLIPDTFVDLSSDSTATSVVDRIFGVGVDSDGDGAADVGVSPLQATRVLSSSTGPSQRPAIAGIDVDRKSFSPDLGQVLSFLPRFDKEIAGEPVLLTARVYARNGNAIRTLFVDRPFLTATGQATLDPWDGATDSGETAPGGVYVLVVEVTGSTVTLSRAATSVAVIR